MGRVIIGDCQTAQCDWESKPAAPDLRDPVSIVLGPVREASEFDARAILNLRAHATAQSLAEQDSATLAAAGIEWLWGCVCLLELS